MKRAIGIYVSRLVRFSLALLVMVALGIEPAAADDEWAGRNLQLIDQGDDAIELLILRIGLDDHDKVDGRIEQVTVGTSNERETEIKVSFSGFQEAEFEFEVLDADKRRIRDLQVDKYRVPGSSSGAAQVVTIPVSLRDDTEEGFEIRSSRVKLKIRKAGKRTIQHQFTYGLDKRWAHEIANVNLVVNVTPTPVGATATWVRNITRPSQPTQPTELTFNASMVRRDLVLSPAVTAAALERSTPVATRRPSTASANSTRINTAEVLRNRNQRVIEHLPATLSKVSVADYRFKLAQPTSPTSTEPSNQVGDQPLDLMSLLRFEDGVDFNDASVLGVSQVVYPDANPNSGVYYYVPRGYHLSYNADIGGGAGLGFRIMYDRIREGEEEGTVRMAASFEAPVDRAEIQLAERILSAIDRIDNSFKFTGPLRPFPLVAPPAFDFSGALNAHVDSDDIAVVALSNALEGIDVSWSTDAVAAQNLRRDLRDGIPITGIAGFDPPGGETTLRLAMPIRIDLADPNVYSAVTWDRSAPIQNVSPLPIVLEYVHALVIEGNRPRMYSWQLGDTKLPSSSQVAMDLRHIPAQVDTKSERIWIQYRLDRTCEECIDEVVDELLSGDVWPDTGRITLRSLRPLEMTGSEELWIDVRSRFFDPSDRAVTEGPSQVIDEDRSSYFIDPIFLTDRVNPETGDEWPLFEYRISAIMPDGDMIEGANWLESDRDTIVIGPVQIEQSIGYLPGDGG